MAKSLLEGIIVKPTGGRKRIPIPQVPGSTIRRVGAGEVKKVEIEVEKVLLNTATVAKRSDVVIVEDAETDIQRDEVVIQFNIADYMRLINATPPFNINLVGFQEYSDSVLARDWTPEDRFVTMDKHGIVTYKPRGYYLSNKLVLSIEVADEEKPFTQAVADLGMVYGEEEDIAPIELGAGEDDVEAEDVEIGVTGKEGIIGDEQDSEEYISQGRNPTCAITSVAAITIALANEDGSPAPTYEEILEDFSTPVQGIFDANGNLIGVEPIPGTPDPTYTVQDGIGLYETVLDENGDVYTIQYTTQIPQGVRPSGWAVVPWMLDQLGVEHHGGRGGDFTTLIQELEAGNKVAVSVDAYELWGNSVITQAQAEADENTVGLNSRDNHVIWITAIDLSDPDNPMIIINDSGRASGHNASYTVDEFFSAWEDGEYIYTATGAVAPDNGLSAKGAELSDIIDDGTNVTDIINNLTEESRAEIEAAAGTPFPFKYINSHLKDPLKFLEFADTHPEAAFVTLGQMQLNLPQDDFNAFYAELETYANDVEAERQRIIAEYGIDPDEVDEVKFTLFDE